MSAFEGVLRDVWIDGHLAEWGKVNRADICAAFGVSIPQASVDIGRFRAKFPSRCRYDTTTKAYVVGASGSVFQPWHHDAANAAVDTVKTLREEAAR